MEDRFLAAAATGGDQEAFTLLVERYRAYVYTIAFKITLNEDDALDVSQNVFLRLFEKIGTFNGTGTFRAWLATLTTHEALDHVRRPGRREWSTDPEEIEMLADERQLREATADPRAALDNSQRRGLIEGAMAQLSPQQRAIFALRFREDMKPKEIAERLGLPVQQVRSQLCRAVAELRGVLGGSEP